MFKRPLYRNSKQGKVAGVCAGIAYSLDAETWLIRIIAVAIAITNLWLFILIYGAAWLFFDNKPPEEQPEAPVTLKEKVWKRGLSGSDALHEIDHKFKNLEQRLQNIERCVTSREFTLRKQFDQL